MSKRDLLLEIGTEEIPARFLPAAMEAMVDAATRILADSRIEHGKMTPYSTPRRLALIVRGVAEQQPDSVREVFGPPKAAAIAKDGAYTKAAEGFARSQGVTTDKLVVRMKGKGQYIAAVVAEKGRPTAELLPELLKNMVLGMSFPKSMRWSDGDLRFARPIHWFLALYGGHTVSFEIEGIRSGNTTRGHRFLSTGEHAIASADDYAEVLRREKVIVHKEEREDLISGQAAELSKEVSGTPVYDNELLSIVACILENPVCVRGGFNEKYLKLPDELLEAVMVGHQKYFPVKGENGRLLNHFIIASNTSKDNADTVRRGAERVIRARFDDAEFYYHEDTARRLADRLDDLRKVTFHARLGTLHDKTVRLIKVAEQMAGIVCPGKNKLVQRAAELSKADLLTGVVYEFPELQGIMGKYYARNDGEPDEVAEAIHEQYLPAFAGDLVPASEVGTALALADRLDNVVAFLGAGLKASGSEDPFALRRQALGVIAILMEKEIRVPLSRLLKPVFELNDTPADKAADVVSFFEQRIEMLITGRGYEHDLMRSVIGFATTLPLAEVFRRLDVLKEFKQSTSYNDFLVAIKRVRNIMPKDGSLPDVSEQHFREDAERRLDSVLDTVTKDVQMELEAGNYAEALKVMQRITAPVNEFFDHVLVMDKDDAVRMNRLALLKEIWSLAASLAEFSSLNERQ